MRHFLGRGKSQSEDVDLPKINAELFAKIRTDKDGPEFDDAEAGMVIGRIERCAVANVEREGINYRIEMKIPGARVVHVLRMPTAKEMQDHERASTSVVAARRSVETRAFLVVRRFDGRVVQEQQHSPSIMLQTSDENTPAGLA